MNGRPVQRAWKTAPSDFLPAATLRPLALGPHKQCSNFLTKPFHAKPSPLPSAQPRSVLTRAAWQTPPRALRPWPPPPRPRSPAASCWATAQRRCTPTRRREASECLAENRVCQVLQQMPACALGLVLVLPPPPPRLLGRKVHTCREGGRGELLNA